MPAPDILAIHAANLSDKIAVIDDRPDADSIGRLTFAELNSEVNRLAHVLLELGVQRDDKVVFAGKNSVAVVRMMHAARKLGATAVPLNYRLSAHEAAYVVDHCDARLVYADAEFAGLFDEIRPAIPQVETIAIFDGRPGPDMLDGDALLAAAGDPEPPPAQTDQPAAMMIYTSGTTGKPKGAFRRGMGNPEQVGAMAAHIGYRPDDIYLTTGPLYHSGPGGFMTLAHSFGNTVVVQRRFDPEDWLRLVSTHRVTSTFAAPTPIRMVCNLPAEVKARYDTSSMRIMIANAAPWSYALKLAYLEDFPDGSLWEVYGSTELGVNAILAPADQRRKKGSCGRPAPKVELMLIDEEGNPVTEPHVPGELFVRSATIFDTYYKAHDKYEEERRGDFHTVGDIAYFDEEGFYFICDRKKDMIISGGMNIYPAEIEAALESSRDVADVAVFGIPSEQWGESVHAVVVPAAGAPRSEQAIIDFAREQLAGYKVPRSVSFVEEIPRTGSGKILKRVLREPFWAGRDSNVA